MADRVVALFVEGPTEIEFYKAVVIEARKLMGSPYSCEIEYVDMKGIGNYKKDALRKFNKLKRDYCGKEIIVFLCIDQDVFEFSKKPPFDKTDLKKSLLQAGASSVTYIVADPSIEEWFLCDFEGVLNYLHLPKTTKEPRIIGQDALKRLFRQANRVYVKGGKTEGFIDKLSISKIMKIECKVFKPLCNALELDCKAVCERK